VGQVIPDLTALVKTVAALIGVLGPVWTLALIALAAGIGVVVHLVRAKRERTLAEEKERQIQRMADEIRMYRYLDLKRKGLTETEITGLLGEGKPVPLSSKLPWRSGKKK